MSEIVGGVSGAGPERPVPPEPPAYPMLGVQCQAMNARDLHRAVEHAVEAGGVHVFGNHNLHSVYLYHRDPEMRRFYARARYVFIDGMPLVWLGRVLGFPLLREHRNTPLDWFPQVLGTAAEKGWRVFYLGSAPGVAERGAEILRARYPGLQMVTEHGFFDASPGSEEAEAVLRKIQEYRPDILCVGMGMPRQERWIADFADRTGAHVVLSLGALMDLIAGVLPQPPRWIGRAGFEWLYRLLSRPHLVWRRYLVEPWFLLPYLLRDVAALVARSRRRGATQPPG